MCGQRLPLAAQKSGVQGKSFTLAPHWRVQPPFAIATASSATPLHSLSEHNSFRPACGLKTNICPGTLQAFSITAELPRQPALCAEQLLGSPPLQYGGSHCLPTQPKACKTTWRTSFLSTHSVSSALLENPDCGVVLSRLLKLSLPWLLVYSGMITLPASVSVWEGE